LGWLPLWIFYMEGGVCGYGFRSYVFLYGGSCTRVHALGLWFPRATLLRAPHHGANASNGDYRHSGRPPPPPMLQRIYAELRIYTRFQALFSGKNASVILHTRTGYSARIPRSSGYRAAAEGGPVDWACSRRLSGPRSGRSDPVSLPPLPSPPDGCPATVPFIVLPSRRGERPAPVSLTISPSRLDGCPAPVSLTLLPVAAADAPPRLRGRATRAQRLLLTSPSKKRSLSWL
jgi:hypothetical protein